MAKVIQFPRSTRRISQLVDEIIETRLSHSSPQVLNCLKRELRGLVEKYYNGEEFASTLVLPAGLSDSQFKTIEQSFQRVFLEHNERFTQRSNAMFLDLCLAKMKVCELEFCPADSEQ